MKILVYSSVFYPAIGGIENLTLFLIKEFVKDGHEVKVITEQKQDKNRPLENIEVIHSSDIFRQIRAFFWSNIFYMPNITLKGAWLMFLNPFKKWVISHNDFHLMYSDDYKAKFKWFAIRCATKNIAVCKAVADISPYKSTIIFNGYDDNIFRIYEGEQKIYDFVFVGRLVSQKGCDLLIEACKDLKKPFTLNFVGDGPEIEILKTKVDNLGLSGQIKFLGFIQNENLARLMNRHRTMIIPSLFIEGFPLTALEGLACGCQMIVSDSGGLPEAIDKFGEVFPIGDKVALTALLDSALSRQQAFSYGDELRNYLSSHTKDKVAKKYLEVFND